MAIINTKLIKYATQARFDIDIAKVPAVIDSKSIVFVEDTGRIYAHGKYFGGAWEDITDKPNTFAPSAHSHGPITNDGKIGTSANRIIETTTGGLLTHVAKNTAYNKAFGTGENQVARGNHTHAYLPLSGGKLTGDLEIFAGNTDKFIKFAYNTTDAYAWRIGYLGTGAGNENRLAFQSAKTSGASYVDALSFGLDDLVGKFAVTPTVGNTKVSLEGHNHILKLIAGASTATTNSTADVANPYIRLFSDNVHQGNIRIVGGTNVGAVSKNGVVTLTATDTTYTAGSNITINGSNVIAGNYPSLTKANLDTGTATTQSVATPQVLASWLSGKGYATESYVNSLASYVGGYNYANGFLVKTNVARTENSMLVLHIKGNSYGGRVPINTFVQVYNYVTSDSIIQTGALNNGYAISEVKVFYYNNLVYFWVPQQTSFITMTFQLLKAEGQVNRVDSVTNTVVPASGVEKMVTITPRTAWFEDTLTNLSQLTDNIGVATHIANKSNPHSVTKAQVGLGSVNNTSDANKPISTATQNALNGKLNLTGGTLSNSSFGGSLTIHRIAANNSTIKFTATSGNPWYIGMDVVTGEFGVVNSAVGITTSKVKLNGSSGLITGTGFSKTGATDAHMLLGSGGHKAISDFVPKQWTGAGDGAEIWMKSDVTTAGHSLGLHFTNSTNSTTATYQSRIQSRRGSGNYSDLIFAIRDTDIMLEILGQDRRVNILNQLTVQNNEVYHTGNLSPVTLNTTQTITGAKNFTGNLQKNGVNVALINGTYSGLRAQATTKADVGLSQVPNLDFRNYGVGRTTANVYTGGDVDVDVATGLYSTVASSTANTPIFASSGSLIMLQSGASGNAYKSQIWVKGNANTNNQLFFRHRKGTSGWNSWDEVYHTGNFIPGNYSDINHKHNASDITSGILNIARIPTGTTNSTVVIGNDSRVNNGQTAFGWGNHANLYINKGSSIGDVDLNTIFTEGSYRMSTSSWANSGNNYPSGAIAGQLLVFGDNTYAKQIYKNRTGRQWERFYWNSWSNWLEVWNSDNFSQTNINNWNNAYNWGDHSSAGYVLDTRTVTAGNGLTGGGNLKANRTITLGTPSAITALSSNSVSTQTHSHLLQSSTVNLNTGLNTDIDGFVSGSTGSPRSGSVMGTWSTLRSSTSYGAGFFARANQAWFRTRENGVMQGWNELYHTGNIPTWNQDTSGTAANSTTWNNQSFVTGTQTSQPDFLMGKVGNAWKAIGKDVFSLGTHSHNYESLTGGRWLKKGDSVEVHLGYRLGTSNNHRHEIIIPWAKESGSLILDVEILIATSSVGTRGYTKRRFYLAAYASGGAGVLYSQDSYIAERWGGSSYNHIGTFRDDPVNGNIVLDFITAHNRGVNIKLKAWGYRPLIDQILGASVNMNIEEVTRPGIQNTQTPIGSTFEVTNDLIVRGTITGNASSATNLSRSILAGNGLSGGGVLNADRTLTLGTPSTLTATSTNTVGTTNHSHAITTTTAGLKNTIVQTDSSGDITARHFRSTAGNSTTISGAMAYRISGSDNYIRFCSSTSAIKTWLGLNNVGNDDFKNYGLGSDTSVNKNPDDFGSMSSGFYGVSTGAVGNPVTGASGTLIHLRSPASGNKYWAQLHLLANGATSPRAFISHGQTTRAAKWEELYHTGNFANGTTSQYIRGDGSLATYSDTKYSALTAAEASTGTATTARTISAKVLADEINRRGDLRYLSLTGGILTGDIQYGTDTGTGSYFFGTTSSTNGYGSWMTQNIKEVNGVLVKPRGTLASKALTINHHKGMTLFVDNRTGLAHGVTAELTQVFNVSTAGVITAASFSGNINASSLNTGTVPNARISGTYTGLTNLTGTGNVDFARFIGNAGDTVAAPSITWTGDLNTGIYRPIASQVAITTGGVQRALFSSAGITGTLVGNASTATKLASITTTFTGTYPVAFNVNGNIYSHTGITFTGSTGTLTATTFSGSLTGNASTATTATNTTNINTLADNSSNAARFILFSDAATGNQRAKTDSGLKYNPSSNTITATLAGNASSATTASKLTINSSASSSWFDILWNSGTTVYGSTNNKLRVQPSTGSITSGGTITASSFSGNLSGSSDNVYITDSRGAVRDPSYYTRRAVSWNFEQKTYTGAGGDSWNVVNTISKWTSFNTSHRQEQVAYTGASLKHRVATSDTVWGSWNTILDSSNSSVSGKTITINGTSTTWVDTHRGIQNNLTSTSTSDSLSAAQGRLLANGSARDSTKLALSGGTLTGVLTNTSLQSQEWSTATSTSGYRSFYNLAFYGTGSSTVAGDIQIEVPITTSTMWRAKVVIKNYNKPSTEIIVEGYTTTNSYPYVYCNNPNEVSRVRLGRSTTGTVILITHTALSYPKIVLEQFDIHHSGITSGNFRNPSKYSINVSTDETGITINKTINNSDFERDSHYMTKNSVIDNALSLTNSSGTGLGVGSATNPVYFSGGKPVATTYSLGKSVPSTAVFTDTHWTSGIRVGASGTTTNTAVTSPYIKVTDDGTYREQFRLIGGSNVTITSDASKNITIAAVNTPDTNSVTGIRAGASGTTTNAAVSSNPYIKVIDDSTYRSQIRLLGSGATTVKSDASGNVTISSSNTNTTYSAGAGLTLSGTQFSLPVTVTGTGTFVKSVAHHTNGNGITVTLGTPPSISIKTNGNTYTQSSGVITLPNIVTTGQAQTISGLKTFSANITMNSALSVAGNVTAAGFFQSSDTRLKNVIEPLKIDIKDILNIPSFYFTYKDKKRVNIGTSAQEVQKVFPEIVSTNSKGMLSVEYDKFGLIALDLIKTQQKEIDTLKYELNNLKLKIDGYRN